MRRLMGLVLVVMLLRTNLAGMAEASRGAPRDTPGKGQQPTSVETVQSGVGAPLFVENVDQWDAGARFQMWGGVDTTWLAEDAVWITLVEAVTQTLSMDVGRSVGRQRMESRGGMEAEQPATPQRAVNLKLSFVGANPHPKLEPYGRAETKVSYFIGADAQQWHADVPVWGGVRYVDLYPGIDLIVGSEETATPGSALPWRLAVRDEMRAYSHTPLQDVRLRIEGADEVTPEDGGLRVRTAVGEVRLPLVYLAGGASTPASRQEVAALRAQPLAPAVFEVPAPFTTQPPARLSLQDQPSDLRFATFLGGSGDDRGMGIAVDGPGCAYNTGWTWSADFPAARGPGYDTSDDGGIWGDAYVVKLNASGTALVYATFLGGSGQDFGSAIAVDGVGCAYVTGRTDSADFPAAQGSGYDTAYNGSQDGYVVKLNASGTALAYATFLGGGGDDVGRGIELDGAGCTYVTGETLSADFPAAEGPGYDASYNGSQDAYVVKLNAGGTALAYATFLGGGNWDFAYSIALDGAGCAYVTGWTESADFPAAEGPGYDTIYNGSQDAFVVKLNASGTALAYATFLGGSGEDLGFDIEVDGAGCAYVTGCTYSSDFPAAQGPGYDNSYSGNGDSFVVKLCADGTALVYATFLGGATEDSGNGIAVDGAGCAYVTGSTTSAGFPAAQGPGFDTSYNGGGWDAYMAKLNASGTAVAYATFLGGSGYDYGRGIAVDGAGCVFVTGETKSADFPAAQGPGYDASYNGSQDTYVIKLRTNGPIAPSGIVVSGPVSGVTGMSYVFDASVTPVTVTTPLTYTWTVAELVTFTHLGGLSDSAELGWSTPGTMTVTVTARNAAGAVLGSHSIAILLANATPTSGPRETPTPTRTPTPSATATPSSTPTATRTPPWQWGVWLPLVWR